MKKRLIFIFAALLPGFHSTQAEIYKTIDQNGNVVFSDQPSGSGSSEKVELKKPTEVPSLTPQNQFIRRAIPQPEAPEIKYDHFEITAPKNDTTVRNNGDFQIKVTLRPSLALSHKVRFWIDEQPVSSPQRSLQHSVSDVDRGTHQLKVELLDNENRVLDTATSIVHVRRTIYHPPVINSP